MAQVTATMMAIRVTVTMAATRLPITTTGTPLRTMVDTPRPTMPRPIMVLGTGVLSVPHTHITALGTIVGIAAIGDRRRDDARRQRDCKIAEKTCNLSGSSRLQRKS